MLIVAISGYSQGCFVGALTLARNGWPPH